MNVISRRPMTLASFLKEASSAGSGIKYAAEKGKMHRIYIPSMQFTNEDGTVESGPIAEMHFIHEWKMGDKFYSAECLETREGRCPYCERVSDAWLIYNERIDRAKAEAKAAGKTDSEIDYLISGEQDKEKRKQTNTYKGLKSQFSDELKMKDKKAYLYMLIALYECDAAGNPILLNNLPKYQLKVMKLPQGRVEKFYNLFVTNGGHIEGNEMVIQYKDFDDRASLVGQSDLAAVFPDQAFYTRYPGLKEKINEEALAFDMESISKSFDELKTLEMSAAKSLADSGFAQWDAYQIERQSNPGAKYMEYASAVASAPQLNSAPIGLNFGLPTGPAQTAAQPQQTVPQLGIPGAQTQPATQIPPVTQAQPVAQAQPAAQAGSFNFTL